MKNNHLKNLALALATAGTLASCTNEIDYDSPEYKEANRINEYTTAWVQKFGPFDPNHDWCMLRAVDADIAISAIGGTSAQVYNCPPNDGGRLIGIASGDTRLVLDLPKTSADIYALITDDEGNNLSEGTYDVSGSVVRIDGNATPVPEGMSRYAHGSYSWFDAMLACEDLGSVGDFDFNDVVFGLRHIAGTKTLEIMPMAAGGTLPVTVKFDGNEIGEIHSMLAGAGTSTKSMLNTDAYNIKSGVYTVKVDQNFSIANDWSKLSLVVNDGSKDAYTITGNTKDSGNTAPQIICLGGDWYWPTETTDIIKSYPSFKDWTNNADVQTWCNSNTDGSLVVPWGPDDVRCYFVGSTSSGTFKASVNDGSLDSPVTVASYTPYYTSAPTTCKNMFNCGTSYLTGLYLQNFDVSHVTDMMGMFQSNYNLETIAFGENWNPGQVTSMENMFYNDTKLKYTDGVSNWDVRNVTNMLRMFYGCRQLTDTWINGLATWSVSAEPINMSYMFYDCEAITSVDLSTWHAKPTSLKCTFVGCSNLKSLNLDDFDVTLLGANGDQINTQTISNCRKIENLSLKRWKIPAGLYLRNLLQCDSQADEVTCDFTGWDCTLRTDEGENYNSLYRMLGILNWVTTYNVTDWVITGVKDMTGLFQDCPKLSEIIGINTWNVSSVKNMSYMFAWDEKLATLDLSAWRTDELTNVYEMFYDCKGLTTVNLSGWNPVKLENAYGMFWDCIALTTVNLSGWNPVKLENAYNMFSNCSSLETIDLSGWHPTNLQDVSCMFYKCSNLKNLYIDNLDLSGVSSYGYMFYDCTDNLKIRCSAATKAWMIEHADDIKLPTALQNSASPNWL